MENYELIKDGSMVGYELEAQSKVLHITDVRR